MKYLAHPLYAALFVLFSAHATRGADAAEVLVAPGAGSSWQYLDGGKPAAPDWNRAVVDTAGWKSGAAPLGYGHPDNNTTVAYGRLPEAKPITTYFRRQVDVADAAQVATLALDLRRDDGAVVYWNGVEILRSNMPTGAITARTLAATRIEAGNEIEYRRHLLPAAGLPIRKGANVLAVEIHQVNAASSDIVFDLALQSYASGETPPADRYAEAYAAVFSGDTARAIDLLLQLDTARAGYAQLALQAAGDFLGHGGATSDPRYWTLQDRARGAAPNDMDVVSAWIHAHVAARKDLAIQPARRAVPASVDERWRFINDTPPGAKGPLLPRADLLADIDDLELLLENCYSYLERRSVDYRGALDALRASITTDLDAATFAHRVARMMTIFGDPHSGLLPASEARVPVRFVMDGERVAVLKYDRSGLLDPTHPYLSAINGQPAAQWLAAAEQIVSQASPQYRRLRALEQLRRLGVVARQLQLSATDFELTLASADGAGTARLPLQLGKNSPPAPPHWPARSSELRADNIGYLRITSMESSGDFTRRLDDWMSKFNGTRGLIIDVRGNSGGSQDAIQTMLPWLMKPGSPMKIINVAAYRLPLALPSPNGGGFLGFGGRDLYPATSAVWTADEARQVRAFLANWKPAWQLPAGKFSDWHVMAVKPGDAHGYYDKPVIVLQDGEDFSATDNFLGALKGHPNVTLMGMASGGGSGRMADYVLPHSKLQLTLCRMASFTSAGQLYDGNGVQPDVVMPAKLGDQISGGGDSVLDAAVARLLATPAK